MSQIRRSDIAWSDGAAGPVLAAIDEPEDWTKLAACQYVDPEIFFVEKGGNTGPAKKVCSTCQVRAECLEYALGNDERFGVWAGLNERERRRLKRQAA